MSVESHPAPAGRTSVRPVRYSPRSADILLCLEDPWTGGGPLPSWVRQAFPRRPFHVWPPPTSHSERLLGSILAGAVGYRIYRELPRKPVYLTVLTDPLARVAAAYDAAQADLDHPLRGASPGEFLRSEFARARVHDGQTRQLVDPADADLPTSVQREIAEVRLDEFAFFALADRWADSAVLFGLTFGVAAPEVDVKWLRPPDLSRWQGLEDEVRARNPLDTALLEVARRIFTARLGGAEVEASGGSVDSDRDIERLGALPAGAMGETGPMSPGRSTLRVPLREDDLLLFVHIPKTGGLSLITLLDDRFGYREILPLHSVVHPSVIDMFSEEQIGRYRMARGHFLFGPYDGCLYRRLVQNPVLATFLREPVARSLSALLHTLRRPQLSVRIKHIRVQEIPPGAAADVGADLWTHLRRLLDDPRHAAQLRNRQTQFVVGAARRLAPGVGIVTDLSDRAMLELALERIEQMAFVGLTERYAESLHLLADTFGWRAPEFMPRLNVSHRPDMTAPMPADLRDRLEELTEIDRRLYDRARALFDVRWNLALEAASAVAAPPSVVLPLRMPMGMRARRALWGAIHVLQRFRMRWLTHGSLLDRGLQLLMGRWLTR